jgi:arylsulfatase A-like enzyme
VGLPRSMALPRQARVLLLAAALLAPGPGGCTGENRDPRPSFVFVLVDAMRRDRLATYGSERAPTPFLDGRAAHGLVFEHAVAQAPWTTPSMASLWTSRYPTEIGVDAPEDTRGLRDIRRAPASRLAGNAVTLAAILARHGYRASAVVANANAGNAFGLLEGFSDEVEGARLPADRVVDLAIERVDAARATQDRVPLFLYLHFVDAHSPNRPPPPYDRLYPTRDGAPHQEIDHAWPFDRGAGIEGEEFEIRRSHKLALYDGSLRFVDDQLRRLAAHLAGAGLADRFVWVVAADHGEEFWDHVAFERAHLEQPAGWIGVRHGHTLFGELLDVPLLLWGPGVPQARVPQQVRNLDVAPTVLGLAGIAPPASMRGIDVVAALRTRTLRSLPAYSTSIAYGHDARSLEEGELKLVVYGPSQAGQRAFLFARPAGALEDTDLSLQEPARAAALHHELDAIEAGLEHPPPQPAALDPRMRRQLEELGYAE